MILQPITVLAMNSFWGNFAGIRPLFRDLTALRGYDGGGEGGEGGECSADGGESVFVPHQEGVGDLTRGSQSPSPSDWVKIRLVKITVCRFS